MRGAQSPVCPCTACCMLPGWRKTSLVLLPSPQTAFQLCCLSALYLACPYRCLHGAREGSTLQNAGRDDLGGFSTPVLLRCFCSEKCSKSSRVIPRPFSHCWGRVYLTSWLSESARNYLACFRVGESMHSMLHAPWLEKDFSRPPAISTDSVSAVLFVGLVSCLSIPLSARGSGGQYFAKCRAGWFRRFFYTSLAEMFLFKKML